jgi:dynein heavy chain
LFPLTQVEISKNYGMPEWRDNLRSVLRKAGEQDKKVMFLFTDTQIKKEGFVEDINSLLNTGEVRHPSTHSESAHFASGDFEAI